MASNRIDLDKTLQRIKAEQWALADIDWDAPGAERISPKLRPNLKKFMTDLIWIEQVGARGFAALSVQAPTPQLREIYEYFHAEEQRHANAQLALMRRWDMLEDGEIPQPNTNIRMAINFLDSYADEMPLESLGTLIPMLEVALDGALLKFLLDEVEDPVCHQVFQHVNADESRHLAVGFHVMDELGMSQTRRRVIETLGSMLSPKTIVGWAIMLPLMIKIKDNLFEMGLDPDKLKGAVKKFRTIGDRSENTKKLPSYQFLRNSSGMLFGPKHAINRLGRSLVQLTDRLPQDMFNAEPAWIHELTYESVV